MSVQLDTLAPFLVANCRVVKPGDIELVSYGIRLLRTRSVRHGYRGRPEPYFDGPATNVENKVKTPSSGTRALEVTG